MTEAQAPLPLRVVAGSPTPEEVAAVTAVLAAQLEAIREAPTEEAPVPSRWVRGDGVIREPWVAGAMHWTTVGR